jgi:hypothetical protein
MKLSKAMLIADAAINLILGFSLLIFHKPFCCSAFPRRSKAFTPTSWKAFSSASGSP